MAVLIVIIAVVALVSIPAPRRKRCNSPRLTAEISPAAIITLGLMQ